MPNPFRFGVQLSSLPPDDWADRARRIETLGYSTIFWPDHFGSQWDPVAALAGVAAATSTVRVGSLVYDVDFRHPVVFAKAAATIQLLSGGRHEFGLGAGWMESDYVQAGLTYDRPGIRIERLDEALQIIRSMWTQETTTFSGVHYRVNEVPQAADLPEGAAPVVLVGGGGKRVLTLAGRHADIVGINPTLHEGKVTNQTAADLAPERVREKTEWAREGARAAGRDPDAIEFNSLVFVVALTDDPKPLREGLAGNTGMSVEQVADCPLFLTGSGAEIQDRLQRRREETGISYVCIQGRDPDLLEQFAEQVVAPLRGA
ncbi:MAG: TIGR03621 family F420-dependent LLM class oxidoreductase [Proteobacteria bacterium]|nr:TIGR03621 family F420-dependent LLM class oxidoreductase [Pseudomonadota bacterium]